VPPPKEKVGLVLAGGGARGAYEIGALSYLLPELAKLFKDDWRPQIVLGTSAGALNAAFLGARADQGLRAMLDEAQTVWADMSWGSVISGDNLGEVIWPWSSPVSLLEPGHLAEKVKALGFDQIGEQLRTNRNGMETVGLVTTLAATSLTRVFYESRHEIGPNPDDIRGIEYVKATLGPEYAMASAAIPSAFPAVNIPSPEGNDRWYYDGGTRVNTAITPALALGAEKLIIVALNHPKLRTVQKEAKDRRPRLFDGMLQLIQGILVDPLISDLATVVSKEIPYIIVAPTEPSAIGEIAMCCFKEVYGGLGGAIHTFDKLHMLGYRIGAGTNPDRAELFSYLFFHEEFAAALMRKGEADARRWFEDGWGNSGGGPFRVGPLPDY
jgi:NTE family protein